MVHRGADSVKSGDFIEYVGPGGATKRSRVSSVGQRAGYGLPELGLGRASTRYYITESGDKVDEDQLVGLYTSQESHERSASGFRDLEDDLR